MVNFNGNLDETLTCIGKSYLVSRHSHAFWWDILLILQYQEFIITSAIIYFCSNLQTD